MRRLHPPKCVCEHGQPWYAHCDACGPAYYGSDGQFVVEDGLQPGQVVFQWVSNREAFFRSHPDAAKALTQ